MPSSATSSSDDDCDFIALATRNSSKTITAITSNVAPKTSDKRVIQISPLDSEDEESSNDSKCNQSNTSITISPLKSPVPAPKTRSKREFRSQVQASEDSGLSKKTLSALNSLETIKRKKEGKVAKELALAMTQPHNIIEITEEETFDINFIWKQDVLKVECSKVGKLGPLFDKFAKMVDLASKDVSFYLGELKLKREDTIDEIKLGVASCIEARPSISRHTLTSDGDEDEDRLELKFQCSNKKKNITLLADGNESMASLQERYAKERSLDGAKIRFFFDGIEVSPNDTPETLDMEGGECIDVLVS